MEGLDVEKADEEDEEGPGSMDKKKASSWKEEEVAKLRRLSADGYKDGEIAKVVGHSRNAVRMMRKSLSLKTHWGPGNVPLTNEARDRKLSLSGTKPVRGKQTKRKRKPLDGIQTVAVDIDPETTKQTLPRKPKRRPKRRLARVKAANRTMAKAGSFSDIVMVNLPSADLSMLANTPGAVKALLVQLAVLATDPRPFVRAARALAPEGAEPYPMNVTREP